MENGISQDKLEQAGGLNHPRLGSPSEFLRDLFSVIGLFWKMRKSLSRLDPLFRETICLTVTLINNCGL